MPDRPDKPFRPGRTRRPASAAATRRDGDEIRPSGPRPQPRPHIPEDADIRLPRGLRGAIERQVPDDERSRDVQRAMTMATRLIDEGEGVEAARLLAWAKAHAARVPEIREALGVAHYQAEQWRPALNELRTYRRMSGNHGQNHLIADCLRALGQPTADVAAEVEAMLSTDGVQPERVVEGLLVWAGAMRDDGDVPGARAVLRRADGDLLRRAGAVSTQRWRWLTADLAEADGDHAVAVDQYRVLARLPEDPWGAALRLARLDAGGGEAAG